jgi:hypothetical protein
MTSITEKEELIVPDISKINIGPKKVKGKGKQVKNDPGTPVVERGGARAGSLGLGADVGSFDLSLKKKTEKSSLDDIVADLVIENSEAADDENLFGNDSFDVESETSLVNSKVSRRSKSLFGKDDEDDIGDLRTDDLMVSKWLEREEAAPKKPSADDANPSASSELNFGDDTFLDSLEQATKMPVDDAMDLFSAAPSVSKDVDDGLFAALSGGNGNDDMSDINAYIESQSANDGGLFD